MEERVTTTPKKRILFVDDEPAILAGLQNLLYKDRKRWELVFAKGGESALDEMRKQPFDVVVSDMRMPGIDGATLLNRVKTEYPATVRIMLSGHAEREAIVRALPAVHQLLSKPCDAETLRATIERSLEAEGTDRDALVRAVIGRVDKLPSPPAIFRELTKLIESPTSSIADVARLVARDPALSAKVLQLVNSAYFGAGHSTSSIQQAVSLLGSDRLRYIALTASVFSSHEGEIFPGVTLQGLQEAAVLAAGLTRKLLPAADRDEGFAATLLHDVGHVVLALGLPTEYRAMWTEHERTGATMAELERSAFGTTHAEVGSCLLSLWGLPNRIADIVRNHHDPGSAMPACRLIASAVHVADALTNPDAHHPLNEESLARAGTTGELAAWRRIAENP
jgi:HD-like signal output (HDOD) protein/CheY-like chemotaxis protein